MQNIRLACLLALSASTAACGAEPELADGDGPSPAAARVVELAPAANYVATLVPSHLRQHSYTVPDDAESIAEVAWRGFAWALDLDPVDDAATVGIAAYVGPCGMNEAVAVVAPSVDADVFAARVDAAIAVWRRENPIPPGNDAGEAPDPALAGWVPVQGGTCTILQRSDYDTLVVTLTHAGVLELRDSPFANGCSPGAGESGLPSP